MESIITINHILFISSIILIIGLAGIFYHKNNLIMILMSIEVSLIAININFIAFSYFMEDLIGQIFTIFILSIAAAEVAIGLAIAIILYHNNNKIDPTNYSNLKY